MEESRFYVVRVIKAWTSVRMQCVPLMVAFACMQPDHSSVRAGGTCGSLERPAVCSQGWCVFCRSLVRAQRSSLTKRRQELLGEARMSIRSLLVTEAAENSVRWLPLRKYVHLPEPFIEEYSSSRRRPLGNDGGYSGGQMQLKFSLNVIPRLTNVQSLRIEMTCQGRG